MTTDTCASHIHIVEDTAFIKAELKYLRKDLSDLLNRLVKHVDEGEKEGGFRDRLIRLEADVSDHKKQIKRHIYIVGFASGLFGALVGQATPELIRFILDVVLSIRK